VLRAEKGGFAGSTHDTRTHAHTHTAGVVSQRIGSAPGIPISVYTGAVARFLVGNSPSTCPYVIWQRQAGEKGAAGGGALVSRAPPAPMQRQWTCKLGPRTGCIGAPPG
jgi:hypothetical protein